jgi:hypothetical protein
MLAGPGSAEQLFFPVSACTSQSILCAYLSTPGKDSDLAALPATRYRSQQPAQASASQRRILQKNSLGFLPFFLPFSLSFYLTVQKDQSHVCFFFKLEFFF